MDKVKAEAEAVKNAQVETVTDANGLQGVKVTFDSGILFATNSSTLNASSQNTIKQIADVLKNNSDVDVAIFGHTDSTGNDAINNPLSEKRAKAVESQLKKLGVTNIKRVEGQGSKNPVADNSTAEGKKQNRRVEVYMYASEAMVQAAEAGTLK
jgi:outer membrane protein OmpA-like peptidoglycan-associated protein